MRSSLGPSEDLERPKWESVLDRVVIFHQRRNRQNRPQKTKSSWTERNGSSSSTSSSRAHGAGPHAGPHQLHGTGLGAPSVPPTHCFMFVLQPASPSAAPPLPVADGFPFWHRHHAEGGYFTVKVETLRPYVLVSIPYSPAFKLSKTRRYELSPYFSTL